MRLKKIISTLIVAALGAGCAVRSAAVRAGSARPTGVPPQVEVENIPPIPRSLKERLRQYHNTRSASFADWIPEGRGMLISTRFGGAKQIHRVDRPMGARYQLTFGSEPVSQARWARWRGRDGFVFLRDVGGAEAHQLFHFDVATGTKQLLSDGKSRNRWFRLSGSGRRLAYSSTRRTGRHFDLWVQDLQAGGAPRLLARVRGYWMVLDWSPDEREVLALQYLSANRSFIWRIDVADGKRVRLRPPAKRKVAYWQARYSADGKGVYYVSNERGEFLQLSYLELSSGGVRLITGNIPWDVETLALDRRGRWLAFISNEEGISRLRVWALPGYEPLSVPKIPVGQVNGLRFDRGGRRLALTVNASRSPSDAFVLDLETRKLERWTRSEVGGLDTRRFVSPRLIRYPTFDKVAGSPRRIPAFYYRPPGKGPFPVIVLIHGGPESQYRPRFVSKLQYFVLDRRIAVLAPNVRGSSGYGKGYLRLDDGFKREDSVKDIGALLDWIGKRPELDATRVMVLGGSYGGYMVLASMARFAGRIRAGVDVVGISNFVTFLEGTKKYRRDLRRAEYGDERRPKMRAFLQSISPTNLVHLIKAPLFVAQGLNDPRVPAAESRQIVDKLKARGVPTWYMLARNEGHGFRKKANSDYYTYAVALFIDTFLTRR